MIAEAADLSTVLRHVPARVPHVLVLDLRMPSGSSADAIRRLRSEVPDTEIVVLTMEESPRSPTRRSTRARSDSR